MTELRHPLFDTTDSPRTLDCLDAIDRIACVIDLLSYLNLSSDTEDGLPPAAASGHQWLSEMMRDTLRFSSDRLAALNRKQRKKGRKKDAYLLALRKSLDGLADTDRDFVLNATAAELQATRAKVDTFIDRLDRV